MTSSGAMGEASDMRLIMIGNCCWVCVGLVYGTWLGGWCGELRCSGSTGRQEELMEWRD